MGKMKELDLTTEIENQMNRGRAEDFLQTLVLWLRAQDSVSTWDEPKAEKLYEQLISMLTGQKDIDSD